MRARLQAERAERLYQVADRVRWRMPGKKQRRVEGHAVKLREAAGKPDEIFLRERSCEQRGRPPLAAKVVGAFDLSDAARKGQCTEVPALWCRLDGAPVV